MREGVFFIWLVRVMFILMIIGFSYRPPGRPDNLRRDDIHCLCVIVPLWILFESWRFHTWRTSRWLTDNGNGFTIRSRSGGEERFDDEAVETYSLSMRPVLNLFSPTMIHQRVTTLWIRGRKVALESFLNEEKPDLLRPFLERIELKVFEATKRSFDAGIPLSTEKWVLEGNRFRINSGFGTVDYFIDQIEAVTNVRQELYIWVKGQQYPIVRLPFRDKSVPLLAGLLERFLNENLKENPDQELSVDSFATPTDGSDAKELGRFLYESRHDWRPFLAVVFVDLLLLLTAGLDWQKEFLFVVLIFSAFFLAPSLLMKLAPCVAVYQKGMKYLGLFRTTTVLYRNVSKFSYEKSIQYGNGIYILTWRYLSMSCLESEKAKVYRFWRITRTASDLEIEILRDRLTEVLHQRMEQEFRSSGSVRWNDQIAIFPEGILLRERSFMGKMGDPFFVPFENLQVNYYPHAGLHLAWNGAKSDRPILNHLIIPEAQYALGLKPGTMLLGSNSSNFFPTAPLLLLIVGQWAENQVKHDFVTNDANNVPV